MNSPRAWALDLHIQMFGDDNYTSATVFQNGQQVACGFAKRDPRDAPDPTIGADLAVSRALERLAHKTGKRGARHVARADHRAAVAAEAAARKAAITVPEWRAYYSPADGRFVDAVEVTNENAAALKEVAPLCRVVTGFWIIRQLPGSSAQKYSWADYPWFVCHFEPVRRGAE